MEDPINDLQMPSEELKNIKERIAIVTAAVNEAEVRIQDAGGSLGRAILPLCFELKALRVQAKNLESGKTNQTTDPGPGAGSTEVSAVSGAPGCGFG